MFNDFLMPQRRGDFSGRRGFRLMAEHRGRRGGRGGRGDGEPGGRGGGRGHRGGGPRGRFFGHGDLRLVLLSLIAEQPRYGYDLIRLIADATGGMYRPSPGVVYPTLTMLEDLGHIRGALDSEQRRLHEITSAGRSFLEAHAISLEQLKQRMPGGRSPQVAAQIDAVRAAMEDLKRALRATLSSGPVDERQLAKIVAAIATATREVTGSAS